MDIPPSCVVTPASFYRSTLPSSVSIHGNSMSASLIVREVYLGVVCVCRRDVGVKYVIDETSTMPTGRPTQPTTNQPMPSVRYPIRDMHVFSVS